MEGARLEKLCVEGGPATQERLSARAARHATQANHTHHKGILSALLSPQYQCRRRIPGTSLQCPIPNEILPRPFVSNAFLFIPVRSVVCAVRSRLVLKYFIQIHGLLSTAIPTSPLLTWDINQ